MSNIEREATPEEMAEIEAEVKKQMAAASLRRAQGQAPLRIHAGEAIDIPAADDDAPAADNDAPAVDDNAPAVDDNAPAVDDNAPAVDDNAPAADDEATAPVTTGFISNAAYFAALNEYIAAFPWDNEAICPRIMNGFLRYTLAGLRPDNVPFIHLHVTGGGEKERGDLYRFIAGLFAAGEIAAVPAGADVAAANAAMESVPGAHVLLLKDAEPILPALPYLVKRHGVAAVLSLHEHTALDDLKELPENALELHLRAYLDETERALMAESIHASELNTAREENIQAIKGVLEKPLAGGTAANKRAAQEMLLTHVRDMAKNALAVGRGTPAPGLAQHAARVVKKYFASNLDRCPDDTNPYYNNTYSVWPRKVLPLIYAAGDTPEPMLRALTDYATYLRAVKIEPGIRRR